MLYLETASVFCKRIQRLDLNSDLIYLAFTTHKVIIHTGVWKLQDQIPSLRSLMFNHFYLIVILFVSICYWDHKLLTKKSDLLGPFHIKNEMIISKARHTSNSSCSIFPSVEVDKGKSLQSIGKARGMRINIIYHTKKFKEFIFKSSVLVHQLQISWQTLDWPVFLSFAK